MYVKKSRLVRCVLKVYHLVIYYLQDIEHSNQIHSKHIENGFNTSVSIHNITHVLFMIIRKLCFFKIVWLFFINTAAYRSNAKQKVRKNLLSKTANRIKGMAEELCVSDVTHTCKTDFWILFVMRVRTVRIVKVTFSSWRGPVWFSTLTFHIFILFRKVVFVV